MTPKKPLTIKGNDKQLRLTIPKAYGFTLGDEVAVIGYEDYLTYINTNVTSLNEELKETKTKLAEALEIIKLHKTETITNTELTEKLEEITELNKQLKEASEVNSIDKIKLAEAEKDVEKLEAVLSERYDNYLAGLNYIKLNATHKIEKATKETEEEVLDDVFNQLDGINRFSLFMKNFKIDPVKVAEKIGAKVSAELEEENKYILPTGIDTDKESTEE